MSQAFFQIRTYENAWQAGMAKSVLEGEGITALIDPSTANPYCVIMTSGVKLLVLPEDAERAEAILSEWEQSAEPLADDADVGEEE